jgi:hypothetical protein
MADSFTTAIRLRKIADGGDTDTWGAEFNGTLDLIDELLFGVQTLVIVGDYTLAAIGDDASSETRKSAYVLSGSPVAPFAVILPTGLARPLLLYNPLGYDCTVKYSGSAGVVVLAGSMMWLYADGTDVYEAAGLSTGASLTSMTWFQWMLLSAFVPFFVANKLNKAASWQWVTAPFSGGGVTFDYSLSNRFVLTLTADLTSTQSINRPSGAIPVMLLIKQDSVGGRSTAGLAGGWIPRRSLVVANAISTATGFFTFTVTDVANGVALGDFVTIANAAAVGGIDPNGTYTVQSIVDANNYKLIQGTPATSNVSAGGGGLTVISYGTPLTVTQAANAVDLLFGITLPSGFHWLKRVANVG